MKYYLPSSILYPQINYRSSVVGRRSSVVVLATSARPYDYTSDIKVIASQPASLAVHAGAAVIARVEQPDANVILSRCEAGRQRQQVPVLDPVAGDPLEHWEG